MNAQQTILQFTIFPFLPSVSFRLISGQIYGKHRRLYMCCLLERSFDLKLLDQSGQKTRPRDHRSETAEDF